MWPHMCRIEGDIVSFSFRTCSMRFAMSIHRITSIVDGVAMTLVNAALIVALPMSAVLFVTHSI